MTIAKRVTPRAGVSDQNRPRAVHVSPARGVLTRFRRSEDGAITILSLFFFVVMLAAAGLGIDVMRHEMARTHLQSTLDSAVLAGAGAPADATEEEIKAIVEDYFQAAGLSQHLNEIDPEKDIKTSLNSKRVTASASLEMDTFLMRLAGVKTMAAGGGSTAAIASPKLEISLVVDASGSMRGDRMTELKAAAKEFVTTIIDGSDPGNVAISIVPYSWNVTPPQELFDALSVDKRHDYSTCIHFTDDEFQNVAVDPDTTYAQSIYTSLSGDFNALGQGDPFKYDPYRGWVNNSAYNQSCYTDAYFQILPYSNDKQELHDKIDALQAAGSTSTDLGMKWGVALLDPAFQPVVQTLQAQYDYVRDNDGNIITLPVVDVNGNPIKDDAGQTIMAPQKDYMVDPSLKHLPARHDATQVLKIVVLMGDGANDYSFMLADPNDLLDPSVAENHSQADYRGPDSTVYEITYNEAIFERARLVDENDNVINYSMNESKCGDDEYNRERRRVRNWWGGWYYTWVNVYVGTWECDYTRGDEDLAGHYIYTPAKSKDYYDPARDQYFARLEDAFPYIVDQNRLSWEEAWGLMSPRWYEDISGDSSPDWQYSTRSGYALDSDAKDDRLEDICDEVKSTTDIVVYSIAFAMGDLDAAKDKLRDCASAVGNFYEAKLEDDLEDGEEALNISQVFGSIAANVQKLRLTQ